MHSTVLVTSVYSVNRKCVTVVNEKEFTSTIVSLEFLDKHLRVSNNGPNQQNHYYHQDWQNYLIQGLQSLKDGNEITHDLLLFKDKT